MRPSLRHCFQCLGYWVAAFGIFGSLGADGAAAVIAVWTLCDHVLLRRLNKCTPTKLDDMVWDFLNKCEFAEWHDAMHPKFHWLVHLPWGLLLSALVCEAKHKVPKRYGKDQCNLTGFDMGGPDERRRCTFRFLGR